MAKKKTASPSAATEPATKGQISVITLKGSQEMRDWLASESKRTHYQASTIVRLALALWAKENGAEVPPEK